MQNKSFDSGFIEADERSKFPDAFITSEKEALQIYKTWRTYSSIAFYAQQEAHGGFSPRDRFLDALRKKRISVSKLCKLYEKVRANFWTYYFSMELSEETKQFVGTEDFYKNGVKDTFLYIESSDPANNKRKFPHEDVFKLYGVQNPDERRAILGLNENLKYIPWGEFSVLRLLYEISPQETQTQTSRVLVNKSTPELESIMLINNQALQNVMMKEGDATQERIVIKGVEYRHDIAEDNARELERVAKSQNKQAAYCLILDKAIQSKQKTFSVTVDELIKLRGLKDRKTAQAELWEITRFLRRFIISRNEGRTVSYQPFLQIVKETTRGEKKEFILTLSDSIYALVLNDSLPVVLYPTQLFLTANNYALRIGAEFARHKRRNVGKANENKVSVKTLLSATTLPEQESLKVKREAGRAIIGKFIAALDNLQDTGVFSEWHFMHPAKAGFNAPLTDEELERVECDYTLFISLIVSVKWGDNEPDYTNLKERKAKQQSRSKTRKRRA